MWIWSPKGILLLQIGQFTVRLCLVIESRNRTWQAHAEGFTSMSARLFSLCDSELKDWRGGDEVAGAGGRLTRSEISGVIRPKEYLRNYL